MPGQGSSFVVSFPLASEAARERAAPRILVCDDEPQILRALRVILRDAGYEAVPASQRRGGARPGRGAARPQAAILDLMLPDIDGVEVTRRLREWSEMPIIVLSAVGEEDRKVEALAAGADDYVTKPFGPRELVARLEAALRRARPEAEEPAIVADGLEIDLAARSVRRDGEEVHLTPTEFELLRVAGPQPRPADDPPRPAGRGLGASSTKTTCRSCAPTSPTCAARSSRPRARALIRTDPGVGYRFALIVAVGMTTKTRTTFTKSVCGAPLLHAALTGAGA